MKGVLLLSIFSICVLSSLCRPTDCNKAVRDSIMQIRLQLNELERIFGDILESHQNKTRYDTVFIGQPISKKSRKHNKYRKTNRPRCGKMNNEAKVKVPVVVETTSTSEPTTIDYTTETLTMIVSTDAENLTTELSGGFADNPTTLSN